MLVENETLESYETAAAFYSSLDTFNTNNNEPLIKPKPDDIPEPQAKPPTFTHKRVTSNPFDVIYHDNKHHKRTSSSSPKNYVTSNYQTPKAPGQSKTPITPKSPMSPLTPKTPTHLRTPSHLQYMNYSQNSKPISEIPPIITLIDQGTVLKRTTSVASKDMSLRRRKQGVKRNRNVNREHTDNHSSSGHDTNSIFGSESNGHRHNKSLLLKLRFLFPVRRKTSLKKNPSYQLLRSFRDKVPKFKSKQELDAFLEKVDAKRLMKELIPNKMKLFKFTNLLLRKPFISSQDAIFSINDDGNFSIKSSRTNKYNISSPIKETFVKNELAMNRQLPAIPPHQKFDLLDTIYNRYRKKVFTGNYMIPPKFSEFFPEELDNNLLTPEEIDHLNRKVLLEVLMRRTLAAKIDYRLKLNGWYTEKRKKNRMSKASKSSSGSSDDSDGNQDIRHSHIPKLVHTDSESSPDDESIDTDDLMQQNASLVSGLLPSPQISYKSDIFGSEFDMKPSKKGSGGDLSSRYFKSENKLRRTASTNDLKNLVKNVTPHTPKEGYSPLYSSSPVHHRGSLAPAPIHRPEHSFFSGFDKSYTSNTQGPDKNLVPQTFDYELRPLNRSVDTFSSSEDSRAATRTPPLGLSKNNSLKSKTPPFELSKNNSLKSDHLPFELHRGDSFNKDKRDSNTTEFSNESSFDKNKRVSQSTGHTSIGQTSIFQELDELSNQLNSFVENPDDQRFIHKNVIKSNEIDTLQSGNQQSIIDPLKLSKESLEQITVASQPMKVSKPEQNQSPDVQSLKGSISMVGSSEGSIRTAPIHNSKSVNPDLVYNLESIHESDDYEKDNSVLQRDDSIATSVGTFGKFSLYKSDNKYHSGR